MALPFITIIISTRPSNASPPSLSSLKKIRYPIDHFEILIIEGNNLSHQRNIGLKNATGEIVYYIDDDSIVRSNALNIIAKEFKNKTVAAVGGPSLTNRSTEAVLGMMISYVLETFFGALRMRYRYSQRKNSHASEFHLIGANLALRKSALESVGMFDSLFHHTNDETDLLRRLSRKYELRYNKNLFVYREQRRTIRDLLRQFHSYGSGRMRQLRKAPTYIDSLFFFPIFFPFYLISIPLFHPNWYLLPLAVYVLCLIATAGKASLKHQDLRALAYLPVLFPVIHLSYSLGLLNELRKIILRQERIHHEASVTIKRVVSEEDISQNTALPRVEPKLAFNENYVVS